MERIDLDNQLIPNNISLHIDNFEEFISVRKELLKKRFAEITGGINNVEYE